MFRVSIETNFITVSERVTLTTNTHEEKPLYGHLQCSFEIPMCSERLVRTLPLNGSFHTNRPKNLQMLSQKKISHVILKHKRLCSNDLPSYAQRKDKGGEVGLGEVIVDLEFSWKSDCVLFLQRRFVMLHQGPL